MTVRLASMLRGTAAWLLTGLLATLWGTVASATEQSTISALKRLDVEDLMGVEVTTVGRRSEKLLDAAAAVQVIHTTEIRRSGATSVAEALRLADSLQVAQRSSASWAVSARGFNTSLGNKLLVMIDGRTVYTPLFSGVFWEAQDYLLEDIERIEVVSGPGGALWGANAVNGVINIITRSSADSQGLHLMGAAGPELQSLGEIRFGGAVSASTQYRVYGKYLERDAVVYADGSSVQDEWNRGQAGFRMDSQLRSTDLLTVQGDYYSTELHEPGGTGESFLEGANLLGRWTRANADGSGLTLQVYYDWTRLSDFIPALVQGGVPLAPAGRLHDDLHTFDLDFQHQFSVGDHNLIWGLGFRHTHDVARNAPALAFVPSTLDQQLYSAFFEDEIRLTDKLSLSLGTKIENNDYTGWEFEPGVRLRWQPDDTRTAWAAVSRAIRAPSRVDRDLQQPSQPYIPLLYGSDNFRSEEVVAWELGYRAQPSASFAFALSGFFNEYDHVRSTTVTPQTLLPFRFANGVAGQTWGMEFTGDLQITSRWSVHLGYNLLEEDLKVKPGEIDINDALNETADPEQQVSLRSSIDLPGRVSLDAALRWVDTLHNNSGPTVGTVPHYTELDLRLAWQATSGIELALVGQNLLHEHHPEYGFPSPQRPEIERSVFGSLTWRR